MALMLMSLMLLRPVTVHADALFDFQMNQAQKGNAEAQFKVGEMYETGFGVKQDKKEAEKWITRAADQGHETASFKLLYWDVEKKGVNAGNKDKVTTLKNKAADGNAQAQYYVGKMYAHGVGVKQDPDIATGWLNKAALVGVMEAEQELAWVREDKQRAALARQQKEKQQAELRKKQEREKKLKQEQQRKRQLQEQKQAEAKARAKAKAEAEEKARAEKVARDKKAVEEARLLQLRKQAEQKQREAQKQAMLQQRKAEKKQPKQQFEADPCSGKSARFLSTCR
jgi:TPR repeat protein